jgi:ABC-type dipeptide/oligopeptide/nickel transport system permease component
MSGLISNAGSIVTLLILLAGVVIIGVRLGPRFVVRRIAGLIFVLLGVTFVTFILGYLAPSDAAVAQLGNRYTPELAKALRHFYGLDLPWYEQYGRYLGGLLHFDLGTSFLNREQTVWDILRSEVPISTELGVLSLVVAVVVGVPMGITSAVRANTHYDTALQTVGLVLYTLPPFAVYPFFALAMIWLNNNGLPNLPVSSTEWPTDPVQWIAPILIFSAFDYAYFVRITRTSMLDTLGQDYVRTARAKGLSERAVLWRHAFRNTLIPLVTVIGPSLAFAVNGVFILEDLFNIPGIGAQTISSVVNSDFPVVEGTVIILAVAVALMNLVTDIVYGLVDPRIEVV